MGSVALDLGERGGEGGDGGSYLYLTFKGGQLGEQ